MYDIEKWAQKRNIFPLSSQIQQMADNIAADIDKQLAAKTKELLGWL